MSKIWNVLLVLGLGVVIAGMGVGSASSREQAAVITTSSTELANKTEQCVQDSASTDSSSCKQAAAKAAEVKQTAPVVVTVPRRTDAEVKALIEQTIREHPDLVPRGVQGDDYVLTDADKQTIADIVLGKIPPPAAGAAGKDAVVDYDKIIKAVTALIPIPQDGITPACMNTPAQCQGTAGQNGEDGRGVDPARPPEYVRVDGQCVLRMYFTKAPDTVDIPSGTFACPL